MPAFYIPSLPPALFLPLGFSADFIIVSPKPIFPANPFFEGIESLLFISVLLAPIPKFATCLMPGASYSLDPIPLPRPG